MARYTRRVFFRASAERLALLAVTASAAGCVSYEPAGAADYFTPKETALLLALADTLVPAVGPLAVRAADTEYLGRVARFLQKGDPLTSQQFRYLLAGIEHYPQLFTTYFTRFSKLPPEARAEVLTTFSESRYYAKRMIFVALKSVVCNHYFADPLVQSRLGYAPVCRW